MSCLRPSRSFGNPTNLGVRQRNTYCTLQSASFASAIVGLFALLAKSDKPTKIPRRISFAPAHAAWKICPLLFLIHICSTIHWTPLRLYQHLQKDFQAPGMCIAKLNVSTAECSHRWYELVRSCSQGSNLSNCTERIRLEGWENRREMCPFCSPDNDAHESTHRLFGSVSSASSVALSPVDAIALGRTSRRGSANTINTPLSPLSRQSSACSSMEIERAQRSKDMNDRIHLYLSSDPHEVLPSAKKYYPTYAGIIENGDDSNTASSSTSIRFFTSRRTSFSRGWRRMSSRLFLKPV